MKKLTHTIQIGRFEVTGQYEGVPIAHDGSLGMRSEELERLELQAAIAVFSQRDLVNGDELRFARDRGHAVRQDAGHAVRESRTG